MKYLCSGAQRNDKQFALEAAKTQGFIDGHFLLLEQ